MSIPSPCSVSPLLVLALCAAPSLAAQNGVPVGGPAQGAVGRHQVALRGAVLVSIDTLPDGSDGASFRPHLSHTGRHVAFDSLAMDLVLGDTNGASDVFVRDRDPDQNGVLDEGNATTARVSLTDLGGQANGASSAARLSVDGRHAIFESAATDLVAGDANGRVDVFARDRDPDQNGVFDEAGATTVLVSRHDSGAQGDADAFAGDLSSDGRFVVFVSAATTLVSGDTNGVRDVFVHDRDPDQNGVLDEGNGTTRRISLDDAEAQANGPSAGPAISPDGRFVVFESEATNLSPFDGNGASDVFVRDRDPDGNGLFDEVSATTARLSLASGGAHSDGASRAPALSADGRFVVFESDATNLAGDFNGLTDVFVRDRDPDLNGVYDQGNGLTWRLSSSDYMDADGPSRAPSISADGRFVAFESQATNLVAAGQSPGLWQVFLADRDLDQDGLMDKPGRADLWRVSLDCIGAGSGDCEQAALGADGSQAAFSSTDAGIVAGDGNGLRDVFARAVQAADGAQLWYRDQDGDGYGVSEDLRLGCDMPAGFAALPGDCDDALPAIHPAAVDLPDDLFADTNCDGIDGDVAGAVFVHPLGSDAAAGTIEAPVASVSVAVALALAAGKDVYVAEGTYAESATLALEDGVSIYGGYDVLDWSRDDAHTTQILVSDSTAVEASGITTATVLDRLELVGGNGASPGASTYALFATASDALVVHRCELTAGLASAGGAGNAGGGQAQSGGSGNLGQSGCEDDGFPCGGSCGQPQGGNGGFSPAGNTGGKGGAAQHDNSFGSPGFAGNGPGGGAGGQGTPPGQGGWAPPLQYQGAPGADGATGSHGAPGAAQYLSIGYAPSTGGPGGAGEPGSGGGGGGGGGGGDFGCDSYGGGGGGGGGAPGDPGQGGDSGGGSFAIFLWDSDLVLEDCLLSPAGGGDGGAGGNGELGGGGGSGANLNGAGNPYGGSEQDDGSNGGRGGDGGKGGDGGAGGGGAGGPSIGVYRGGTSNPTLTSLTFDLGPVGTGGASAGNPGPDGDQVPVL